ncbi:MAG: hypothetical protein MI919_17840, partial [Holophagales bacterium]|nr:hypothetical protein [Holophagales bacterium]
MRTRLILALASFSLLPAAAAQAQPTFSKVFLPDTIGPGSTTTLRFDITNPTGTPADSIDFIDTLPAGVTIATPGSPSTDCGGFAILTAPDGGSTISLSSGQLGVGQSCTVSVDVVSSAMPTPGLPVTHMNVSGLLTSSIGSAGPATDDLVVVAERPGFTKSFSPSTISPGQTSTLTFTVDNTANPSDVGSFSFLDNLPVGLVVASPSNAVTDCGDPLIPPT